MSADPNFVSDLDFPEPNLILRQKNIETEIGEGFSARFYHTYEAIAYRMIYAFNDSSNPSCGWVEP